jgi:hypothetical protein
LEPLAELQEIRFLSVEPHRKKVLAVVPFGEVGTVALDWSFGMSDDPVWFKTSTHLVLIPTLKCDLELK